jgi:hypothetical protein
METRPAGLHVHCTSEHIQAHNTHLDGLSLESLILPKGVPRRDLYGEDSDGE